MKIPTWNDRDLVTSSSDQQEQVETHEDKKEPQQQSSQTTKKSVGFADYMVVYEIPTRSEYTTEEVEASWYSSTDYSTFDQRDSILLSELEVMGHISNPCEESSRGLENHTRAASSIRRRIRYDAKATVFNEQYRQRCYGVSDEESIAQLYHETSFQSQYAAYTQGMLDEQDSQEETTSIFLHNKRVSDRQNVLRNVISIERGDDETDDQEELVQTTTQSKFFGLEAFATPTEDFSLDSFFQDMIDVATE